MEHMRADEARRIVEEMNKTIFDLVLDFNSKYVEAIGTEAEEPLLDLCSEMFEKLILKQGLVNEYAEYCERRRIMG